MLKKMSKFFIYVVTYLSLCGSGHALTICSINCPPDPSPDPGADLPQLVEYYSVGDTDLTLSNIGLIFLDINLFNNHPNLTIVPGTDVYASLDELPASIVLPPILEFKENFIGIGGVANFSGTVTDYLFMMDFDDADILNITSSLGIVLVDGADLTAVPVPASIWLFVSGTLFLVGVCRRKECKIKT